MTKRLGLYLDERELRAFIHSKRINTENGESRVREHITNQKNLRRILTVHGRSYYAVYFHPVRIAGV